MRNEINVSRNLGGQCSSLRHRCRPADCKRLPCELIRYSSADTFPNNLTISLLRAVPEVREVVRHMLHTFSNNGG